LFCRHLQKAFSDGQLKISELESTYTDLSNQQMKLKTLNASLLQKQSEQRNALSQSQQQVNIYFKIYNKKYLKFFLFF
jgi:hypothetical protein